MSEKVLGSLGLCRRAGALVCGVPMICGELPKKKIFIVFEAEDTSDGTHKKLTDKCLYYGTRHLRLKVGGERLAAAVGKSGFLAAVAIKDANLAALAEKAYSAE